MGDIYNAFISMFTHKYFLAFIVTWVVCIILKTVIESYKHSKLDIYSGIQTGGMPSSHSAVVTAITTAIFLGEGATSAFFVSLVFSLIVLNDAFMVRQNVGIQGESLNTLLKKFKKKPLKVVYGHTLAQVLVGMILGFIITLTVYYI
jgi:acid phosphatase family membrane protein YuiD